jgi:hypothetical protein
MTVNESEYQLRRSANQRASDGETRNISINDGYRWSPESNFIVIKLAAAGREDETRDPNTGTEPCCLAYQRYTCVR